MLQEIVVALNEDFMATVFLDVKNFPVTPTTDSPKLLHKSATNPEVDDRSERIEESCEFLLRLLELLGGDNIKKRLPWQC